MDSLTPERAGEAMDRIDIKAALERRGWSLRRLGVAHGFRPDSIKKALHMRFPNGEWTIADALEMNPWEIWPDRYPDGPVDRPRRRGRSQTELGKE